MNEARQNAKQAALLAAQYVHCRDEDIKPFIDRADTTNKALEKAQRDHDKSVKDLGKALEKHIPEELRD